MIVYHGTSNHGGDRLQVSEPEVRPRGYCDGLKAFCCTESFDAASLFAMRRSPPSIMRGDYSQAGVVMEYVLCPDNNGQTYFRARDRCILQDEQEILIPDPSKLVLQAVHKLDPAGEWKRFEIVGAA